MGLCWEQGQLVKPLSPPLQVHSYEREMGPATVFLRDVRVGQAKQGACLGVPAVSVGQMQPTGRILLRPDLDELAPASVQGAGLGDSSKSLPALHFYD